jgi:chorismate-pyruvate lyase
MKIDAIGRLKEIESGFGKLSGVQKILLSTDGSVTEILDALYGKTQIEVLEQKTLNADDKIAGLLAINENDEVNYREVLMHKDNLPLIYAQSYTPLKRLGEEFKKELAASEYAIGRILKKQNVETRREILSMDIERGESLKETFKNSGLLLGRTYKIIRGGESFMWIKETFSQYVR